MLYISGRISDQAIVEKSVRSPVDMDSYKAAIAANHGGAASDYYIYVLEEASTEAQRITRGDECVYVWTGSEITGVDFSIEDNRKLFMIRTVDPNDKNVVKDTIIGNNTDSVIIQTRTCSADSTLDTSVNASALIPVLVPDGRTVYLKSVITNGVGAELIFKTTIEGIWTVVPTNIMVGAEKMRIWGDNGPGATNTINVLMDM